MSTATTQNAPRGLSGVLLALMAFGAGASVANLYYAQPLLAILAETFKSPEHVGAIAVATQAGYTVGIFFILPLGDLKERRHLIVILAAILASALLACALSSSLPMLVVSSFFVGIGAIVTQMLVPFAADLSLPSQKTKAVGIVFSGILGGILLARTVSGLIAEILGWRSVFLVASILAVTVGILLFCLLPRVAPKSQQSYRSLVRSLFQLFMRFRELRTACFIQACMFAIFSIFWSMLSLHVAQPPFNMGPAEAGAFGIIGIVGVAAANLGGRVIERVGRRQALLFGIAGTIFAFVVLMTQISLPGLILGIVLLDFGVSVVNVANQSSILSLDAQATSRINTIYVSSTFVGGAVGSLAGSVAWTHGGWSVVTMLGLVVAILASLVHVRSFAFKAKG